MNQIKGCCNCGNLSVEGLVREDSLKIIPRICECDFCTRCNAIYLSDSEGSIEIECKNKKHLKVHKQGSGLANFIICNKCGDFIGVTFESDSNIYSSINMNILSMKPNFQKPKRSIPKKELVARKTERWQAMWFNKVKLIGLT